MENKMNLVKASSLVHDAIKRGYAGIHVWGAADFLMKHGSQADKDAVLELRFICDRKYRALQDAR